MPTDSDIVLNGQHHTWGDGTLGTINTIAVVAHEGGHSAGLSHANASCQQQGSDGCGPDFPEATMYWNYNPSAGKDSLELDDIAAIVYGYPRSSVKVKVVDAADGVTPLAGAQVVLLDSAAPVSGSSIAEGGLVKGDVTNNSVREGNKVDSATYVDASPFNNTDVGGLTNEINPTHRPLRIQATSNGRRTTTGLEVIADGPSTITVQIDLTGPDVVGPTVNVTSHSNNEEVGTNSITLAGTATDNIVGGSDVAQVTVDGVRADNDTAAGTDTANWSKVVTLNPLPAANDIVVAAQDTPGNWTDSNQTIRIYWDNIPPVVNSTFPANGAANAGVSNNIAVSFDDDMTQATINTASFTLNNGATGTVTYYSDYKAAVFAPNPPLQYGATYTATVTTGVKDNVGNAMAAPVSFSFTTEPAPASLVPSGGGGGGGGCFIEAVQK